MLISSAARRSALTLSRRTCASSRRTLRRTHRERSDRQPLDDPIRVAPHEDAVLEGRGLTLGSVRDRVVRAASPHVCTEPHFTPVGKPAPPRPRRPEAISSSTSPGDRGGVPRSARRRLLRRGTRRRSRSADQATRYVVPRPAATSRLAGARRRRRFVVEAAILGFVEQSHLALGHLWTEVHHDDAHARHSSGIAPRAPRACPPGRKRPRAGEASALSTRSARSRTDMCRTAPSRLRTPRTRLSIPRLRSPSGPRRASCCRPGRRTRSGSPHGQRSSTRSSCALLIFERPSMPRRCASAYS